MKATPKHFLRMFVLWGMMLPLLAMSLIGTGVMPMRTVAGGLVFVLCPGSGAGRIGYLADQMQSLMRPGAADHAMVENGAHHAMPDHKMAQDAQPSGDHATQLHDAGDCTWAALHPVLDLPTFAMMMIGTDRVTPLPVLPPRILWVVAAVTGLPPATGPPASI